MSVVKIFICRNLSVKAVFQLDRTCQGCRMRRGQKAGKEHAQYGKGKNNFLPSCHALFSSRSFSWLGWQTRASKRSLIFVLVIPPSHPWLSVLRVSDLWFSYCMAALQLLLRGEPGWAAGRQRRRALPRHRWQPRRLERGSLPASAHRRSGHNWQRVSSGTKNNV